MRITFLLLVFFAFSFNIQAQNSGGNKGSSSSKTKTTTKGGIDEDATNLAQELCNCTEGIIKQYHPGIQALFKDMMSYGEEEAQKRFENYLTNASAKDQEKIMADITKMEQFDSEFQSKCIDPLETKYSKYDGNTEFENKMMEKLQSLSECSFTYNLMLMGENED